MGEKRSALQKYRRSKLRTLESRAPAQTCSFFFLGRGPTVDQQRSGHVGAQARTFSLSPKTSLNNWVQHRAILRMVWFGGVLCVCDSSGPWLSNLHVLFISWIFLRFCRLCLLMFADVCCVCPCCSMHFRDLEILSGASAFDSAQG